MILLSLVSLPSWSLSIDDLVGRDGVAYEKFSNIPFNGKVDEGLERGTIKDGRRQGLWEIYHSNGQLFIEVNYDNGLEQGPVTVFYQNGRLWKKGNYKSGVKDGSWFEYGNNENLRIKSEYKNGIEEGLFEGFHENGQLMFRGNRKII